MVVNIYDTANQMEEQMRETQEFKALQEAFETLKNDAEAFDTFKKFEKTQAQLQAKQMKNEKVSDDEVKQMQQLATAAASKDAIQSLMQKEQALDNMLQELNKTITGPIQELYRQVLK